MRSTELWLLHHKVQPGESCQRSLKGVRLVADDHGRRSRIERGGGRQHVLDHRLAGDTVQHFRPRGFHARAFTCREDDDVDVHQEIRRRRARVVPVARRFNYRADRALKGRRRSVRET